MKELNIEEQRAEVKSLQDIFKGKRGEKALNYLKRIYGAERPAVVPNDPLYTGFNDGRRSAYFTLVSILEADIDQLIQDPNIQEGE